MDSTNIQSQFVSEISDLCISSEYYCPTKGFYKTTTCGQRSEGRMDKAAGKVCILVAESIFKYWREMCQRCSQIKRLLVRNHSTF